MNVCDHIWNNKISSAMFGVYLLHDSKLLRQYLWNDVFHNAEYQDTALIIPWSLFAITVVVIGCVIVEFMRQYLIEKPIRSLIQKKQAKRGEV